MNILFATIFNLVIIVALAISLIAQWSLWIWNNRDVTAVLENLGKCDEAKSFPCASQKLAVFLAWRKARWWDVINKQFTKLFSFLALAILAYSGLTRIVSLSSTDIIKYLSGRQNALYCAFLVQFFSLGYLFYIIYNIRDLQRDFEIIKPTQAPVVAVPSNPVVAPVH